MSIQNFLQNTIVKEKEAISNFKHPIASIKGYIKDENGKIVPKPTTEAIDAEYEKAQEKCKEANPYSLENMVGGWVDDIKGEISEKSMLLFGSDEKIVEYYKNYSSIREQEKKQEDAQKEQFENDKKEYEAAKDALATTEINYSAKRWEYVNDLTTKWNKSNDKNKNVATGLQGTTADGDFEWF